jgi:hypothetical protein
MSDFPMTPVESSQIAAIGFADGKLRVQFKDRTKKDGTVVPGGVYEYDAPADAHETLMAAALNPNQSTGGHFHQHIRNGGYTVRRVQGG